MISTEYVGFDYENGNELQDIEKNINFLFATREGTAPGDRNFGLSTEYIDAPRPVAEQMMSVDIIEKVEKYEPRVAVEDIEFSTDEENGELIIKVRFEKNEDYEEAEEEEE